MIEWLVNQTKGYVKVTIEGDNRERFLNLTSARGIYIWDIKRLEETTEFYIHIENVYRLKTILRKTKMRLKVKERYGLPFFLHINRKRKMFLLGLISGWLIVFTMSLYVWNISFEGNVIHTDDELIKFMDEIGIKEGIKQSDIEPEEIEKAIRNKYFDITWTSVEVSGTMIRVHIRENKNYKDEDRNTDNSQDNENDDSYDRNNQYGDIIATKNATVVSIVTRSGTPLIKKGAMVSVGDKLIEGKYRVYGDDLSVLSENYVAADGDIVGRVIYDIHETIERSYVKKIYTGNQYETKNVSYKEDFFRLILPWEEKEYKLYDEITTGNDVVIGNNFYLPFYVGKTVFKEYILNDEKYTDDELQKLANEKIAYILKKIEKNTIQILENNVKIEVNEENCIISGQLVVLEYIGAFGGTYE